MAASVSSSPFSSNIVEKNVLTAREGDNMDMEDVVVEVTTDDHGKLGAAGGVGGTPGSIKKRKADDDVMGGFFDHFHCDALTARSRY
jgi:hypothetical protein